MNHSQTPSFHCSISSRQAEAGASHPQDLQTTLAAAQRPTISAAAPQRRHVSLGSSSMYSVLS